MTSTSFATAIDAARAAAVATSPRHSAVIAAAFDAALPHLTSAFEESETQKRVALGALTKTISNNDLGPIRDMWASATANGDSVVSLVELGQLLSDDARRHIAMLDQSESSAGIDHEALVSELIDMQGRWESADYALTVGTLPTIGMIGEAITDPGIPDDAIRPVVARLITGVNGLQGRPAETPDDYSLSTADAWRENLVYLLGSNDDAELRTALERYLSRSEIRPARTALYADAEIALTVLRARIRNASGDSDALQAVANDPAI